MVPWSGPAGACTGAGVSDEQYCETVERLSRTTSLAENAIADVVDECLAGLSGVPVGALPEMVERLAAQRIASMPSPCPDGSRR